MHLLSFNQVTIHRRQKNEQTLENKQPKIPKKKETTRAELCIERNLLRRFGSLEEDSHGNHNK
jgi:hypothetical protein